MGLLQALITFPVIEADFRYLFRKLSVSNLLSILQASANETHVGQAVAVLISSNLEDSGAEFLTVFRFHGVITQYL